MRTNNKNAAGCAWLLVAVTSLALLSVSVSARAAESDTPPAERVPVEIFQAARPVRGPSANAFPLQEMNAGREGWVLLNMMISPQGKPYEIGVLDSSGNPAFEAAAVKAASKMKFEPARNGHTAVDSSFTGRMGFYIRETAGVSSSFQSAYSEVIKALTTGDRVQVDAALLKLRAKNLYEDAVGSFARSLYEEKWGTEAQQLADLDRAMTGDGDRKYLPKPLYVRALSSKLELEAKSADYGSALATWKDLQPVASDDVRKRLQPTIDQITALRDSDRTVSLPAAIGSRLSWHGTLFRNRFSILVRNEAVFEIKLRCKKTYVFFKYQANVEYTVNPNAGECGIEVVGDPGTTFNLIQ